MVDGSALARGLYIALTESDMDEFLDKLAELDGDRMLEWVRESVKVEFCGHIPPDEDDPETTIEWS